MFCSASFSFPGAFLPLPGDSNSAVSHSGSLRADAPLCRANRLEHRPSRVIAGGEVC